jgi:hypothetical protein
MIFKIVTIIKYGGDFVMVDEINISPDNNRSDNDLKVEDNFQTNAADDGSYAYDMNREKNENDDRAAQVERDTGINKFTMDNAGNMRTAGQGAAAIAGGSRIFLILGWISAAFTAFINPLFAIPGIIFGVLANRQAEGRGTAVIITNVVLAIVYFLLGAFLRGMGWW